MPAAMQERIRQATFAALDRIVELAIVKEVDFVLMCGDLYDAADRSLRAQFRLQQALQRLCEHHIPCFIIHGNHDHMGGYQAQLEWPKTVHIFSSHRVDCVDLKTADGQVYASIQGISYPQAAVTKNLADDYHVKRSDVFNIAMLHGNVDGMQGHDRYAPCRLSQLTSAGFDYWALGHIHARAVLAEEPWVVYPGNPQGRHMKENGARGVMLVEVSEERQVSTTFLATDTVRWCRHTMDVGNVQTEQMLMDHVIHGLKELIQACEGRNVLVRLCCKGSGSLLQTMQMREDRLSDLLAELRRMQMERDKERFVWPLSLEIELVDQKGAGIAVEQEEGFLAALVRLSSELQDDLHTNVQESQIHAALEPLYGNYRIRQHLDELDHVQLEQWLRWAEEHALMLLTEGSDGI